MREFRRLAFALSTLAPLGLVVGPRTLRGEEAPPSAPVAPSSAPVRVPHPEPRVIINVFRVHGPHERGVVERSARAGWGRVVKCYKTHARGVSGLIAIEFEISENGKVLHVRRTRSTLKNRELAECLTQALLGLSMPTASRRSTATGEIRVAPGDPS